MPPLQIEGLSLQTGKTYLSALRNLQISLGLPDPREHSSMLRLKRIQAGITRMHLSRGSPRQIRLLIMAQTLERIIQYLSITPTPEEPVLRAVATVAFFGFFRLGELLPGSVTAFNQRTDLSWGDVTIDSHTSPSMIQIHLKISKCDQVGQGADIILGKTGTTICPVASLLHYIGIRGSQPGPFSSTDRRPL